MAIATFSAVSGGERVARRLGLPSLPSLASGLRLNETGASNCYFDGWLSFFTRLEISHPVGQIAALAGRPHRPSTEKWAAKWWGVFAAAKRTRYARVAGRYHLNRMRIVGIRAHEGNSFGRSVSGNSK